MLFSILGIMLDFVHEEDEQDGGNGTLLQYPCLENPTDRGAWQAIIHVVAKCLDMTERLHFPIMGIMLDFVYEKDKQDGHNPYSHRAHVTGRKPHCTNKDVISGD